MFNRTFMAFQKHVEKSSPITKLKVANRTLSSKLKKFKKIRDSPEKTCGSPVVIIL